MDKFLKVFIEEVKIFWRDLTNGCKEKIKKLQKMNRKMKFKD